MLRSCWSYRDSAPQVWLVTGDEWPVQPKTVIVVLVEGVLQGAVVPQTVVAQSISARSLRPRPRRRAGVLRVSPGTTRRSYTAFPPNSRELRHGRFSIFKRRQCQYINVPQENQIEEPIGMGDEESDALLGDRSTPPPRRRCSQSLTRTGLAHFRSGGPRR